MNKNNFQWKFANTISFKIVLPVFVFLYLIFGLVFYFTDYLNIRNDIILAGVTLLICFIISYFILLFIGNFLFHKQNFAINDHFYILGKIKLNKADLKKITINEMGKIYCVNFVSKSIKNFFIYFDTYIEARDFVIKNGLFEFLDNELKKMIYNDNAKIYNCPCCNKQTFEFNPGGTFYICPNCYYEDDDWAYFHPSKASKYNDVSLNQARINYKKYGVCEKKYIDFIRRAKNEV